MKRSTLCLALALLIATSAAFAQPRPDDLARVVELKRYDGRILEIWGDSEDVVIKLDREGPCGSPYFHIRRDAKNFEEATSVALTAFAADKRVQLVVLWQRLVITNCISRDPGGPQDRQVIDHLGAFR